MATINKQRAKFFKDWANKDHCFCTSDDQYFFEEAHANAHTGNLKNKQVDKITRAEYNEWLAKDIPAQLETAEKELEAANSAKAAAQAALDGLPAKTAVKAKAPYMSVLNEATTRAENAQAAVAEAKAAVAAIAEQE